jgi:hypothetical protein
MESKVQSTDGRILQFFRNPVVGIVGSVASIASVPLAVYFFAASHRARDLEYFVQPAKAVVVKAGQTSRLQVTLDGVPVGKDVTAVQVAFWNHGSESIRPEQMLQPLVIRTTGKSRVLEARLRKTSREVSGIALDLSALSDGEVRVSWRILEHNDGGIVQLIYFSDNNTEVTATATVEGQGTIGSLDPSNYTPANAKHAWVGKVLPILLGAMGASLSISLFILLIKTGLRRRQEWFVFLLGQVGASLFIGVSIWIMWVATQQVPFGFD